MDCCAAISCCAQSGPVAVEGNLSWRDRLGSLLVRLGLGRNNYSVNPGLYSFGKPGTDSLVLVTANYKLTFDTLRSYLGGQNLWLLVLDTKGVNVWCAAGKGTFGTGEVVDGVRASGISRLVRHRILVLPQLAAPGVAAHEVTKLTGFKVVYGPVRAKDIPEFLKQGMVATAQMRKVTFTLVERLLVVPIELAQGFKIIPVAYGIFFLGNILAGAGLNSFLLAFWNLLPIAAAWLMGALLVPLLLPVLPFASFALNGLLMGGIPSAMVIFWPSRYALAGLFPILGMVLLCLAVASFLALNFTGATPFTSLSGVKLETDRALPVYKAAAGVGVFLLLLGSLMAGGIG